MPEIPAIPSQVGMTPEQIAAFQVDPNQWIRQVLEGQFLGQNPALAEMLQSIEQDAMRQFQEASRPNLASQLNLSGGYGTALGRQSLANASRDFSTSLAGQLAGIRYQDYGAERDRMQQALQLLSGETVASRQGLFGARDTDVQSATNLRQAQMQADAQRAAARMAAGASRYGADRSFAAARLGHQANFWRDAMARSGLIRGFTGGPQDSLGQRKLHAQPGAKGGLFGGPASTPVRFDMKQDRMGASPDPWNQPGLL